MKKITMIEQLTLYASKKEYKVEIDEKFTTLRTLVSIEELENPLPCFFGVESIGKDNNKIYLVYEVPETYQSFMEAKSFEPLLKLQLIQSLLEKDPLLECNGKTYLDLNNIFFQNYKDIKLLYRSNGVLPFHKDISSLDQYKLCILGFLSRKYSYKQFVINKDNCLKKENNEFFFAVNAADSFLSLKMLIDQELTRVQTEHYNKIQFGVESKKKSKKRTFLLGTMLIIVVALLFAGGLKQKEKTVAMEYKEKIKAVQLENNIYKAISNGDTKNVIILMKKKGNDNTDIANMLLNAGKYDEAIKLDPKIEEKVVENLYELGQKEKILSLKSNSEFMQMEKEIVQYNTDQLDNYIPLISNKNTLKRLGLTYAENGNIEKAKEVQKRLNDQGLANHIKKMELEKELELNNSKLYQLKAKGNNKKAIQSINNKIIDLQKQLIQLEEKMRSENQ